MTVAIQTVKGNPPPGTRAYMPKGGARKLFYCQADEALIEGPANTGKSRAALEKLYFCASKYPGIRCLIARKTRESCTESVLVTWESKVVPDGSPLLVGADRNHRQRYTFPNGSEIIVGGLDKASKIMSTEYDLIYVPEATELTEHDWESLTTRVRNKQMPYNQLIADCNPDKPTHWLNQRCNTGQTERILSRHEDNPTVTEDDLRKLRNLTGARRARLYEGRWAAQEGLVYEYEPKVHDASRAELIALGILADTPDIQLGKNVRRCIASMDWGFTNPGVLWVAALDSDGRAYLVYEVYQSQKLIDWWSEQAVLAQTRFAPDAWYCDPSEPAYLLALQRARLRNVLPAQNEVAPGIQLVQKRLQLAADRRPRLRFYADASQGRDPVLVDAKRPVSTREEFDSYHWPPGVTGKEAKEEPVKDDDHGLDTVRYLIAALDWPQKSRKLVTF
jgi:PBSX family phage terminase large subunit